jgi:hypothetical protein
MIVMKRLLTLLLVLTVGAVTATASTAAMSPTREVTQAKAEWLKEMQASAMNGDRSAKFPSPWRAVLLQRLSKAATLYGFRVVSVQMLHPLQSAPVIVIRSDSKQTIARATPKIINLFDPPPPDDRKSERLRLRGLLLRRADDSGRPLPGDVQPLARPARRRRPVGRQREPLPVRARIVLGFGAGLVGSPSEAPPTVKLCPTTNRPAASRRTRAISMP